MWVDDHMGERVDVEQASTEKLFEIRQGTVACVVNNEIPGRAYWEDQLTEIDDELEWCGSVEHPLNGLWWHYTAALLDALKMTHFTRDRYLYAPWVGLPDTLDA